MINNTDWILSRQKLPRSDKTWSVKEQDRVGYFKNKRRDTRDAHWGQVVARRARGCRVKGHGWRGVGWQGEGGKGWEASGWHLRECSVKRGKAERRRVKGRQGEKLRGVGWKATGWEAERRRMTGDDGVTGWQMKGRRLRVTESQGEEGTRLRVTELQGEEGTSLSGIGWPLHLHQNCLGTNKKKIIITLKEF